MDAQLSKKMQLKTDRDLAMVLALCFPSSKHLKCGVLVCWAFLCGCARPCHALFQFSALRHALCRTCRLQSLKLSLRFL